MRVLVSGLLLRAGLLLAAIAGLPACVGVRLAKCPAEGGQAWYELESEHFVLRTDLPLEDARFAVGYLERTRARLIAIAWPDAPFPEAAKLHAYVLASHREFHHLFSPDTDGLFSVENVEPSIVLHSPPEYWDFCMLGRLGLYCHSTVRHELVHYLSRYLMPRQPAWLSEGLAQYLEELRPWQRGQAILGAPNLSSWWRMRDVLEAVRQRRYGGFRFHQLLGWREDRPFYTEEETYRLYAASWLFVHWLMNTRSEAFAELQGRLARGEDPEEALAQALPELSRLDMEAVLLEYLLRGVYREDVVSLPRVAASYVERELEDAEVHATRATLARIASRSLGSWSRRALERAELAEALRLDPGSVPALDAMSWTAPPEQWPALARAAVERHPEEGGAWLLMARALEMNRQPAAEVEAAYRRAVELSPQNVSATNGLAWLYVTQRRFEEALPLAKVAATHAPWHPVMLDTYASTLAGLGRCAEAVELQERAIRLLVDFPDENLERQLRERLARFQRECQAAPR